MDVKRSWFYNMDQQTNDLILCPRCRLKSAKTIMFGRKAYCINCKYIWALKWKGKKYFTSSIKKVMQ